MGEQLHQVLMKYLGAVAISVSVGAVSPAASLLEIPTELVVEVIEDGDEEVRSTPSDRLRLLRLLSEDSRTAVRSRVAEAAGALLSEEPDPGEELLARLARDDSPSVRRGAARGLSRALVEADPLRRMGLAMGWATSPQARQRAVLAEAMKQRVSVAMSDVVVEVLCADEHVGVRRAAIEVLARRFEEAPVRYRAIALRLVDDPDPRTRRQARRVVSRHA